MARISKLPAPWLTDNLKLMMKIRDKAYSKYKKNKTDSSWNYYKMLRNYLCKNLRIKENSFYMMNESMQRAIDAVKSGMSKKKASLS
ncbi:hypothetical protein NQ317_005086 [Molorchus minor]|uniref:Uncharacterized protein n=1 Tax=Molorchus minor TaxID=1323400 RepID=A0ABQ9J1Q2_9CUCU|nr:hypothetical protein NQ317_005086 [Molorchus minor]